MVDQCCYQNVLYVVIKNQDWWKKKKQKVLLSSLGFKTPVSKIPLLGEILFLMQFHGIVVIGMKWMKWKIHFYWQETNFCFKLFKATWFYL